MWLEAKGKNADIKQYVENKNLQSSVVNWQANIYHFLLSTSDLYCFWGRQYLSVDLSFTFSVFATQRWRRSRWSIYDVLRTRKTKQCLAASRSNSSSRSSSSIMMGLSRKLVETVLATFFYFFLILPFLFVLVCPALVTYTTFWDGKKTFKVKEKKERRKNRKTYCELYVFHCSAWRYNLNLQELRISKMFNSFPTLRQSRYGCRREALPFQNYVLRTQRCRRKTHRYTLATANEMNTLTQTIPIKI